MFLSALLLAAVGLGLAIYSALETEIDDIRRRSLWGILGVSLFALGVLML